MQSRWIGFINTYFTSIHIRTHDPSVNEYIIQLVGTF